MISTVDDWGAVIRIDVDEFKNHVKDYLLDRLPEDGLYKIVDQRCYRDGRWELTLRTQFFPTLPMYRKKFKLKWTDWDTKDSLDYIIQDYTEWVNENGR